MGNLSDRGDLRWTLRWIMTLPNPSASCVTFISHGPAFPAVVAVELGVIEGTLLPIAVLCERSSFQRRLPQFVHGTYTSWGFQPRTLGLRDGAGMPSRVLDDTCIRRST